MFKAHFALFFVNALYGASHVLAKGVMPNFLTPSVFIFMRVFFATLLFFTVKRFFVLEKIERIDLLRFAFCGLFGVAINQLFFFHGLNLSSAINSGIIMTINPIMVLILAAIFLKEKLTFAKIAGITLAATGAILLTLNGGKFNFISIRGDVFLFLNAFSYAIYLIISKPLMKKYSPLTVISYVFLFGLFFVCIYPPTLSELGTTNFAIIPFGIWVKIIYVIVGITFVAYLLTMYGLKHLNASATSSYIYFQPVMVILFSYLFFHMGIADDQTKTITAIKIGLMCMIFLGIWLTSSKLSLKNRIFGKKFKE